MYKLTTLKPIVVAFLKGYTLGGGVGVSISSDIKIVSENTVFGIPEAKIGYFADVGMSYYFARAKNGIGLYLALTSTFLKG